MNCRICLEGGGHFIYPCRCGGTMKYVHEECLLKWFRVNHYPSRCEICHYTFTFSNVTDGYLQKCLRYIYNIPLCVFCIIYAILTIGSAFILIVSNNPYCIDKDEECNLVFSTIMISSIQYIFQVIEVLSRGFYISTLKTFLLNLSIFSITIVFLLYVSFVFTQSFCICLYYANMWISYHTLPKRKLQNYVEGDIV